MTRLKRFAFLLAGAGALAAVSASAALAETLFDAMAAAYANNASLNAARAGLRATDESVPIAKSGLRPQISADGAASISSTNSSSAGSNGELSVGSIGISIDQMLFDGFQTKNSVKSAEAQVRAAQGNLENTTQNTLFDTVAVYMNVVRDREVAALRRKSIAFLDEQVRAANARFQVGEGTRTDVAQAEAQRASARAALTGAIAQLKSSEAQYRQIVGHAPGKLKGAGVTKARPKSLSSAYAVAETNHPAIRATQKIAEARQFGLKATQGQLLPTLSARARLEAQASENNFGGFDNSANETSASLSAQLRIPLYQGGRVAAQIRQGEQQVEEAALNIDATRDGVRAAVGSAWASFEAAQAALGASGEQIEAARIALNGLVAEREVGQRTTLDVLNGQNTLLNAQIERVNAQRNLVVASYGILSATGGLTPSAVGLKVKQYDPDDNFNAVKDRWHGLRTVTSD
jgi:outer membrane protein